MPRCYPKPRLDTRGAEHKAATATRPSRCRRRAARAPLLRGRHHLRGTRSPLPRRSRASTWTDVRARSTLWRRSRRERLCARSRGVPRLARGSAIASGSVRPRSIRSTSSWRTVVMIIEPPESRATNGLPSRRTIVGLSSFKWAPHPSTRFGCVGESKLKSVSSLLSRNSELPNDEAGAVGRLDREGVRDDVAPLVARRQVGGRLGLECRQRRAARVERARISAPRVTSPPCP